METLHPQKPNLSPQMTALLRRGSSLSYWTVISTTPNILEVASKYQCGVRPQVSNKYATLVYPFRFQGNTHHMALKTRADQTMISQRFTDQYQLNCIFSVVLSVRLANSQTLPINH